MRVVRLSFSSASEFLTHFSDQVPEGLIFCWTRAELQVHEPVLAEIDFPELPNQALVRAEVEAIGAERGAWLRFAPDDRTTVDFVLAIARGEVEIHSTSARRHERFPTTAKAAVTIAEEPQVVGTAEDLSAGGAFVRLDSPPAVGTAVRLELEGQGGESLELTGEVAWVREPGVGDPGVGIRFHQGGRGAQKLRTLLRRAQETGALNSLPN